MFKYKLREKGLLVYILQRRLVFRDDLTSHSSESTNSSKLRRKGCIYLFAMRFFSYFTQLSQKIYRTARYKVTILRESQHFKEKSRVWPIYSLYLNFTIQIFCDCQCPPYLYLEIMTSLWKNPCHSSKIYKFLSHSL